SVNWRRSRRCSVVAAVSPSAPQNRRPATCSAPAGGLEAIFTVLALRDQIAPPILNLVHPDVAAEGVDLRIGPRPGQPPWNVPSPNGFGFGFGGVNASVVFPRWS